MTPRQREIAGIFIFSIAIFSLVSLYVQSAGWVGNKLRSLLRLTFGELAVVFGVLLLVASLKLFRGTFWPIKWRRLIGGFILMITGVTLFHLMVVYQGYQLPPSLAEEIHYARMGFGAGVLGATLMYLFLVGFGLPGAYIILAGLFLIGFILVFNFSITGLVRKSKDSAWYAILGFINQQQAKLQDWRDRRQLNRLENTVAMANKPEAVSESTESFSEILLKETKLQVSAATEPIEEETVEIHTNSNKLANPSRSASVNNYRLPPTSLLKKSTSIQRRSNAESNRILLEETFASFGITAEVVNVVQGPTVTRYELQIGPGIKVSRITSLADDLALALAAEDVRIEAPVPGKSVVGIEVPNKETVPVLLRDVLEHPDFVKQKSQVAIALGKDISGQPVIADLKKWLHILVAGATGSGKSVCLNAIIASILFRATPDEVRLLMVDPKRVELAIYDGIPHLITPVVTDPKKAAGALRWAVAEMERRYEIFAEVGARNIDMYEKLRLTKAAKGEQELEHLPYMVIIVDELADLMMVAASDVEESICRLAQMARAAGMYLIIATQRPSVDVITGLIKANVPSRIAFAVSSQVDSRTILDMGGAERLIGKGDMLYYPIGASKPNRAQGAWISDSEVEALVKFWKKQCEPNYIDDVIPEQSESLVHGEDEDELLEDAIRLVVETGQASISMLQRRFRIGYSRAARLIDVMEARSIVGPHQGSKPREVLIDASSLEN